MPYKPVDTAIICVVGPCIDDTDFKTVETAIAYNAAGMSLDWIQEETDGTYTKTDLTLSTGGDNDWTHIGNGYYAVEITAAQNGLEGIGWVAGACTGVLAFESVHYDIVPIPVYNSLVNGTDYLQVDAVQVEGSDATDQINAACDTAISDAALATAANLAAVDAVADSILAAIDTEIAAILADTNELQADWTDGGRLDLIIDAIVAKTNGLTFTVAGQVDSNLTYWRGAAPLVLTSSRVNCLVGSMSSNVVTAAAIAAGAIGNATFAADVGSTAYATNIIALAADKAVQNALLATAAELAKVPKSDSNVTWNATALAAINAEVVDVLRTDTIPDSYAADGAQPTLAQAILSMHQFLTDKSVSGTTVTVRKPDGSTTAMTFTLDSASAPTSITRAG